MKITITLFLVICSSVIFSQENIMGYVGISEGYRGLYFLNSNIMTGISIPIKKTNLSIYGQYQMEGNIRKSDEQDYDKNGFIPSYLMQNHFLGIGMRFRLLSQERIYSPVISTSVLTEVYSNYKGGKIHTYGGYYFSDSNPKEYYFTPTYKPAGFYNSNSHNGALGLSSYYTYYYISTPIIGNINFENEFRIAENLNITVGIGYTYRKIKLGFKSWGLTEQEPKSNISKYTKSTPERNDWHHYIELNISFNYKFSCKKR